MEKLSYELRPYFFLILALFTPHVAHGSALSVFFAGQLFIATAIVLYSRFDSRGTFKGSDQVVEQFSYEVRPYMFLMLAFWASYASHGSKIAMFFAILLFISTSVIVHSRLSHRGIIG